MKILFDIGHPAHFHLFRRTYQALQERGHLVHLISRDKDILLELMDRAGAQHTVASRRAGGRLSLATERLRRFWTIYQMARRWRYDLLVGASEIVGPVARLTGGMGIVFCEDDSAAVPTFARLAYPLAHAVVTPDCLTQENIGPKHVTHPSYHELAYLHPNHFIPDLSVLQDVGLRPGDPFFILRLVAFTAHHDGRQVGLTREACQQIAERLAPRGRLLVSVEGRVPPELNRYVEPLPIDRIHDLMALARLLVSDSGTMTEEAAVLGTPSIWCNSLLTRSSVIRDLEHRYQLTRGFAAGDIDGLLTSVEQLVTDPAVPCVWRQRRDRMLRDKIDLAEWMTQYLDSFDRVQRISPPVSPRYRNAA